MEKNLNSREAVEKFIKLVKEINICMFITQQPGKDHTRPMATIEVEEDGTLWFFSDVRSIKIEEVSANPNVHLAYAHPGKESYLDVWGHAEVVCEKTQVRDKWTPMVKAWFPEGPEDPNLCLLKIKPADCHYWDSETGKMVQFLKMAASVVSGERLADGAKGALNLGHS